MRDRLLSAFFVVATLAMLGSPNILEARSVRLVASEASVVVKGIVKKTREDDEGLVVMFSSDSGSYYLRRTHTAFESLVKKIRQSEKNGSSISVTADKSELNIIDIK